MYFYLVAFGLLAHVLFWGAGLAMLAMPARWRRFWPVLVLPVGFTLQALAVWAGAHTGLRGTDSYAWASEVVPLALLALALRWRGGPAGAKVSGRLRVLGGELRRFGGVGLVTVLVLAALVLPLARASKGLTTISLGGCDAADYAAGARVLMEFARGDREGFLGLTEVVRVMSADNFFDYWTRLNHFVPAALIAFNGTILDCAPHELTSLMTMVLLAGSLPVVFWMARAVLGYGGRTSLAIAGLYGASPITWYGVAHTAMGQLLAAQAIALLTWAGVALWRGRLAGHRVWSFSGVLALGYALVLGSYNFILLVCLVPAAAYAGGRAARRGQWRRLGIWMVAMIAPLGLSGVIFWERTAGLAERLALLQQYDFGWKIPLLSPAGWLGIVADPNLAVWPDPMGVVLAVAVVVALVWAWMRGAKSGRAGVYVALCLTMPPLLAYGYLQLRGVLLGTNASYDAYKVLAVFYPGLLAGLLYWVTLDAPGWRRWLVVTGGGLVLALNLHTAYRFAERMENPPLLVGRELLLVKKIEARADIASVNMRIPDMWARLWANALLLKKPQYFETHTYEGRLNTPLRGTWDLNGGLIALKLPDEGSERLGPYLSLANTQSRHFLRAELGDGWYEEEWIARAGTRWNWTKGAATLRVENPQGRPLRLVLNLKIRSEEPRDLQLWVNGRRLRSVQVSAELRDLRVPEITVPAGASVLELRSATPPTKRQADDPRPLGFAVYGIEIEVKADGAVTEG